MNPTTNGNPEMQLPTPTPGYQPGSESLAVPQSPVSADQATATYALPQAATPVANPLLPPPPLVPVSAPAAASTAVSNPSMADDQDLIEKEWVSKAKQIVEKTRNDPFQQSQELTLFKSDYMQKRYNKIIKSGE